MTFVLVRIVFILSLTAINSFATDCLPKCMCQRDSYICNNANLTINSSINFDVHQVEKLRQISLTGNIFRQIPPGFFGERNHLDSVEKLNLSFNAIRSIKAGAFRNLHALNELDLSNNEIEMSITHDTPNVLGGLSALHKLYLRQAFSHGNRHHDEDDSHWFSSFFSNIDLKNLETLDLSNNTFRVEHALCLHQLPKLKNLIMINSSLEQLILNLTCFPKLHEIHFEKNGIHFLHETHIEQLDLAYNHSKSFKVFLAGNPIHCDCRSSDFIEWLKLSAYVADSKHIKCAVAYPEKNVGQFVTSVDTATFQCPPPDSIDFHKRFTPAYIMISLFLILLMVGLLSCVAVARRNRLRTFLTRMNFRRAGEGYEAVSV